MQPVRFEDLPEWVAAQILDREQHPDDWDEIAGFAAENRFDEDCDHDDYETAERTDQELLDLLLSRPVGEWDEAQRVAFDVMDTSALNPYGLLDHLAVTDRVKNHWDARQQQTLAVVAGHDPTLQRFTQDTVGSVLHVAPMTAANRLNTAQVLTSELPLTFAAALAGELGPSQAKVMAATVSEFHETHDTLQTAAFAKELENRVLVEVFDSTYRRTRELITRAALRIDPELGKQRARNAKQQRGVTVEPLADGMAAMHHIAPAATIETLFLRLNAKVKDLPADDDRTVNQQRSDLLTAAILAGLPLKDLPESQGEAPRVNVYIDLLTMLGLRDEPGHVEGYGPIDADTARDLATDPSSTWHRIVFDQCTGAMLDYGRAVYRPPADLKRHVSHRHPHCTAPGCRKRAVDCEYDHCRAWSEHGMTCPGNLAPLCKRHHLMKTFFGWTYTINPDDSITWTRPDGHQITTRPPPRWPQPSEPPMPPTKRPDDDTPPF